eukprot:977115-Amorphochlora_amoeboformis.AAC.1
MLPKYLSEKLDGHRFQNRDWARKGSTDLDMLEECAGRLAEKYAQKSGRNKSPIRYALISNICISNMKSRDLKRYPPEIPVLPRCCRLPETIQELFVSAGDVGKVAPSALNAVHLLPTMSPTPSSSISALARVAIMTGLAFSFLPTLGHASAAPMAQRTRTSNALTIARPKARLAAPRLTATTAFSKNPVVSRAPRTRHSLIPKSTMAPGARTFEATKEMKQMDSNSALLDEILTDISLLSKEGELMQRPSVSTVFYTVLSATLLSIVSPWAFPEAITEVLVPTSASIIAVCTTAAEFQGKDATADAKE